MRGDFRELDLTIVDLGCFDGAFFLWTPDISFQAPSFP